jgi:hypothetical protein
VGKTRVAIEYAYRFRPEYNLVWWISADQPVRVRSSLAALAPHMGVRFPGMGIKDAATVILEALLHGKLYGRWLLIFDNADKSEDVSNSNPCGPGHVLITCVNMTGKRLLPPSRSMCSAEPRAWSS